MHSVKHSGIVVWYSCFFVSYLILGSHYRDGKGLQEVLSLNGAKIIIVKSPTPGLWKVIASSNGSHTLRITGLSSMYFTSGFGLQPVKTQDEALLRPLAG